MRGEGEGRGRRGGGRKRGGRRTLIIIPLQIAELSLREMLENQPLQFEVAMHGQHKTYKFQVCACECVCLSVSTSCHLPPPTQACSTAVRDMWAQEIRRLLKDQFTLMKGGYSNQHQHRPLFHSPFLHLSPHSFLSSPNRLTSLSLCCLFTSLSSPLNPSPPSLPPSTLHLPLFPLNPSPPSLPPFNPSPPSLPPQPFTSLSSPLNPSLLSLSPPLSPPLPLPSSPPPHRQGD